jgi:hypothetical protein
VRKLHGLSFLPAGFGKAILASAAAAAFFFFIRIKFLP